uniref:deoxyribose-phosphate aldolase n=1 Tax=Sus scrofa TaxID=9823 RepID=A0A8D0IHK2_PIG
MRAPDLDFIYLFCQRGNRISITTAAVCVYPARVCDAVRALKAAGCDIPVASVATGFPAGQTHLKTRLEEIRLAVEDGATEIDVVINRTLVLTGQWEALYDEIRQFRKACGEAHLKTILATGELGSLTNVYKASMIAMMAGSDFIKTSTGKETVNATFPVAIVMLRAIRDFFWKTGNKVYYCQHIFLQSKDNVIYNTSYSHDNCLYMQMVCMSYLC